MRLSSPAITAALLVAALPAAARADAPWGPPAPVPGAGSEVQVVFTQAGHGLLATTDAKATNGQGTLLTPVGSDGAPGAGQRLKVSGGLLAPYGSDRVLVAGTTPAVTGKQADVARVLVAVATPGGAVGPFRALPGSTGQQLYAAAGGADGTAALVTGWVTGHRERVVWIGRGAAVRRALTFRVGERARGATVAVGPRGDVLVVYEDAHAIFSRHVGRTGHAGPAHRLGAGVQSGLQARIAASGRQEVAWISQRVNEGEAGTPAVVFYTSAARGHGFTPARVVRRSDLTGPGAYVAAPGVRLVGSGEDSSVLALTTSDGAHSRTAVADVVAGRVGIAEPVSPAGEDDVLGDLDDAPSGGTLVLWRTATRGGDAVGPQRVMARLRPHGAVTFGPAEVVSPPEVPDAPGAAVDPVTGTAVAAFAFLAGGAALSARPPG